MLRSDIPVALPLSLFADYNAAGGIDCAGSTGDKGVFTIPFKCSIIKAGCIVTENCSGAVTTPVVKFDKRPTAGSDVGRGDGDIAEIKLSTTIAGKVMYDRVAEGTNLVPGEEVVVELTTAAMQGEATSGTGEIRPFLYVEYLPEVTANLTKMVATA
jgi:hypothetical protein